MADKKDVRSRVWFLTCNNPTDNDRENLSKAINQCVYAIQVDEVGKKRGTPHTHTYLRFKSARTFSSIRTLCTRNDVQVAKGNDAHVLKYLSKENKPTIYGQATAQGKRNDISEVRELLRKDPRMDPVVDSTESYQATRFAEIWLKYKEPARPFGPRKVYWFFGETGTGKSYTAWREAPDAYSPKNYKWWDGYDGHKTIILDELRGDWCKFHEILTILGETPFKVECKGGMRQALYDTVYITSIHHPLNCWQSVEDKSQLMDRIDVIREFTGESIRKKLKLLSNSQSEADTPPPTREDCDTEV